MGMAKRRQLVHSHRNKIDLYKTISIHDARLVIMNFVKMRKKLKAAHTILRYYKKYVRTRPVNAIDPFSQEPFGNEVIFKAVSSDMSVTAFGAFTLRAYIESTHNTTDPLSRREFNPIELKRLARLTGGGELNLGNDDEKRRQKDYENTCTTMESQIGEIIDGMTVAVEDEIDFEYALQLIYSQVPYVFQMVYQYSSINFHGCISFLEQMIVRTVHMKGNFRKHIIDILNDCIVQLGRVQSGF